MNLPAEWDIYLKSFQHLAADKQKRRERRAAEIHQQRAVMLRREEEEGLGRKEGRKERSRRDNDKGETGWR